jgi:hypothetical protein
MPMTLKQLQESRIGTPLAFKRASAKAVWATMSPAVMIESEALDRAKGIGT